MDRLGSPSNRNHGRRSVSFTTRAARLQTLLLISASAACLTCIAPSIAMAADDQTPIVLDQVIVNARKRNENLQNVPVAAIASMLRRP